MAPAVVTSVFSESKDGTVVTGAGVVKLDMGRAVTLAVEASVTVPVVNNNMGGVTVGEGTVIIPNQK